MDEPTIVVGLVTKPHGVRGEVAVQVRSDNPERFRAGSIVYAGGRPLTIAGVRGAGARLIVRFAEIADRDAAEALRGEPLAVPRSWLPPLGEGEYWPHELEGCEVRTEAGEPVGVLRGVVAGPAHDLWAVEDPRGDEILVPAVREVVLAVDVGRRLVVVRAIPGLTAPEA